MNCNEVIRSTSSVLRIDVISLINLIISETNLESSLRRRLKRLTLDFFLIISIIIE